eukprot:3071678-Amphidinium_carterae.1
MAHWENQIVSESVPKHWKMLKMRCWLSESLRFIVTMGKRPSASKSEAPITVFDHFVSSTRRVAVSCLKGTSAKPKIETPTPNTCPQKCTQTASYIGKAN